MPGGAADYETKKRKKKLEAEVARVNREILAEEKTANLAPAVAQTVAPQGKTAKKEAKKAQKSAVVVVAEIEPAWDDEDDIETLLLSL